MFVVEKYIHYSRCSIVKRAHCTHGEQSTQRHFNELLCIALKLFHTLLLCSLIVMHNSRCMEVKVSSAACLGSISININISVQVWHGSISEQCSVSCRSVMTSNAMWTSFPSSHRGGHIILNVFWCIARGTEILIQKEKCYLRDICSIHLCGNWTNPTYLEGGLPENDLVITNLSWPDSAYWSCIFSVGYWNQLFLWQKVFTENLLFGSLQPWLIPARTCKCYN